jgi:transposase InsO family protein
MDFLHDALHNGRKFRVLPIIDTFTRECFWMEVDTSIDGQRVVQVLTRISAVHGLPEQIVVDNGPEFISNALVHGRMSAESNSSSFVQASRLTIATWRASTASSGTNV